MKNKNWISTLYLVLALLSTSSYAAQAKPRAPKKSEAPKEVTLIEALRPFIKTIEHPIYIFHYVTRNRLEQKNSGPIDRDDPKVANHLEAWSQYFHSPERIPSGTNGGVYAANNPLLSRAYGDVLYRMEIPAGTRYLDFSGPGQKPVPAELQSTLFHAYGCDVSGFQNYFWGTPGTAACLNKVSEALKELQIGLVGYSWGRQLISGCQDAPDTTFIITDASILPKEGILLNSLRDQPLTDAEKGERTMITRLLIDTTGATPYTDVAEAAKKLTEQEVNDWKGSHLLGCENLRPAPQPAPAGGGSCKAASPGDPLGEAKKCLDDATAALQQAQ